MGWKVEEWRPVKGFEGVYEVSNTGSVRSCRRATNTRVGLVLKQVSAGRSGRKRVSLWLDGTPHTRSVHRLVAQAFIPNPEGHPIVRHLNDKAHDNRVENLAWGTQKDNMQDAVRNGSIWNQRKTHCPQGHEYTEENTYRRPGKPEHRHCRACIEEKNAAARTGPRPLKEVSHGTTTMYSRGCRCEECVSVMRRWWRDRDARRREAGLR